MIRRKVATEVIVPIFNDKMPSKKVTAAVVVRAIMPRENLEQIKPAAMNITADMASNGSINAGNNRYL